MITKLILLLIFLTEAFFVVWNLKQKRHHQKEKMLVRLVGAILLLLCLLCGILQGLFRYGSLCIALLLQAAVCAFFIFRLHRQSQKPITIPRQLGKLLGNMLFYSILLLPAILFPQYKEPKVTGSHQVAICEYTWEDKSRLETYRNDGSNRCVTVKVWYPKEAGSYPLLAFSHGATGMIDSNFSTCQELASNGYIVVSIGHPYQAIMVEDTSGNTTYIDSTFLTNVMTDNGADTPEHNQLVYNNSQEWLAIRTGDINFVLNTMFAKKEAGEAAPFSSIDTDKIGLFGHSLGGAACVEVGRLRDDIDAVIDLEGTMLGEYAACENNTIQFDDTPYPIPLLDVNSRMVYEQASGSSSKYVNFYVGENASCFREVIFNHAAHLNFTDLPLVSPPLAKMLGTGTVDARECIENMNEMILNYFNYYLKGAPSLDIPSEY